MNVKNRRYGFRGRPQQQKGLIATVLAIIVLVATLLAAVALMRSLDASTTIAGSLAFRQSVILESERAYTDAKNSITFAEPTSDADIPGIGYYSTLQTPTSNSKGLPDALVNQALTPASNNGKTKGPLAQLIAGGNIVYYVMERMCPNTGPADPVLCSVPGATIQGGSSSNQTTDKGAPFNSGSNAAFRLTVLVIGQKNTIGYTQTVLR